MTTATGNPMEDRNREIYLVELSNVELKEP